MAYGCSSSFCALERRLIKKELLTWTKKIPVVVGLEVLAETVLNRDILHQLFDSCTIDSGDDLKQMPDDWNPLEPCYLCSAAGNISDQGKPNGNYSNDENVDMLNTTSHLLGSVSGSIDDELDSPLDLRQYPISGQRLYDGDHNGKPAVELKVPHVLQKICKHNNLSVKKNYTEKELVAATAEICSGKIGTRRASVLYGIPRSTLRNKIFRLRSDVTAADNSADLPILGSNKRLFPSDVFPKTEKIKSEFPAMDWEQKFNQMYSPSEHFERPSSSLTSFSGEGQNFFFDCDGEIDKYGYSTPSLHKPKLPFLERLIREITGRQLKSEIGDHYLGLDFSYKHAKPLGRSFIDDGLTSELKIPFYKPVRSTVKGKSGMISSSSSSSSSPVNLIDWNNMELLPPSSRSSMRINSVLKDVITKTISEKFHNHEMFSGMGGGAFLSGLNGNSNNYEVFSSDGCLNSEPVKKHPRIQLLLNSLHESAVAASCSSSSDFEVNMTDSRSTSGSSDGEKKPLKTGEKNTMKKTRPKRGQYRKYNRQLLLEAVKAVQKGDMSVHRAGSYYGVPHSTLEYKVKERHLLRQKKSQEASKGNDFVPTSVHQSEDGNGTTSSSKMAAGSSDPSAQLSSGKPPIFFCKESLEDPCGGGGSSLPSLLPYSYHYPHENGLFTAVSSISSAATTSLPLPVGCFRGSLPVGFGWPPLMAGMFPMTSLPGPLFDAQLPSFGFNMSASDLLKRLQQKVQANLTNHEIQQETDEIASNVKRLAPPLSPEINSGRSSACSIGSPQVAVS